MISFDLSINIESLYFVFAKYNDSTTKTIGLNLITDGKNNESEGKKYCRNNK